MLPLVHQLSAENQESLPAMMVHTLPSTNVNHLCTTCQLKSATNMVKTHDQGKRDQTHIKHNYKRWKYKCRVKNQIWLNSRKSSPPGFGMRVWPRSSGAPEMGLRLPWCSVNRYRRGGSSKSSSETSKHRIYRPTFTANKHSSGTEHSTNPNKNKNERTDQCVKKYVSYFHLPGSWSSPPQAPAH